MFREIIGLIVFLLFSVSFFAIEESSSLNSSSDSEESKTLVAPVVESKTKDKKSETERKKPLSELLVEPVYSGRNYNYPFLEKETYELLEKGIRGIKSDRLGILKWCGRGRVLYCFNLLKESLKDKDTDIRNQAVISLGLLRLPQSIPALVEISKSEKEISIIANIVYSLGASKVKQTDGIQFILNALESSDVLIMKRAVEAIAELGDGAYLLKIKSLLSRKDIAEDVRVEVSRTLIILDKSNLSYRESLLSFFESKNAFVRNLAAVYASELSLKEAFLPSQRAMLVEVDPDVRKSLYKAYRSSQIALLLEEE